MQAFLPHIARLFAKASPALSSPLHPLPAADRHRLAATTEQNPSRDVLLHRSLFDFDALLGGPGRLRMDCALRLLLDALASIVVRASRVTAAHGGITPRHILLDACGRASVTPPSPVSLVSRLENEHGPVHYWAPERLHGNAVDERADVFSFGVVLWEMLAQRWLFGPMTAQQVSDFWRHSRASRAPVSDAEAWLGALVHVAARAIEPSPEQRFSGLMEFGNAVEAVASQHLADVDDLIEVFRNPRCFARAVSQVRRRPTAPRANELRTRTWLDLAGPSFELEPLLAPPASSAPRRSTPPPPPVRRSASPPPLPVLSSPSRLDEAQIVHSLWASTDPPTSTLLSTAAPVSQPVHFQRLADEPDAHSNTLWLDSAAAVSPPPQSQQTMGRRFRLRQVGWFAWPTIGLLVFAGGLSAALLFSRPNATAAASASPVPESLGTPLRALDLAPTGLKAASTPSAAKTPVKLRSCPLPPFGTEPAKVNGVAPRANGKLPAALKPNQLSAELYGI